MSPLHHGVVRGQVDSVVALLHHGVDLNKLVRAGFTALHLAVVTGRY